MSTTDLWTVLFCIYIVLTRRGGGLMAAGCVGGICRLSFGPNCLNIFLWFMRATKLVYDGCGTLNNFISIL